MAEQSKDWLDSQGTDIAKSYKWSDVLENYFYPRPEWTWHIKGSRSLSLSRGCLGWNLSPHPLFWKYFILIDVKHHLSVFYFAFHWIYMSCFLLFNFFHSRSDKKKYGYCFYGNGAKLPSVKPLGTDRVWTLWRMRTKSWRSRSLPLFIAVLGR